MKLLTKEILDRLPKLYATENDGQQAVVQVKFFTPDGSHTFYATEYDGENRFFGLVTDGYGAPELGYFLLSELEAARGPGLGLPIERDRYFKPTSLKVILEELWEVA
tara:strand:+ start:204 stop:524 length:321 start_codon:yes stop_codon:yes gene_type:complete